MSTDLNEFMQKEIQDQIDKPEYNTSSNCEHLANAILGETYYDEKNVGHTPILKYMHCKIGGFEINLKAICSKHSIKNEVS